MLKFKELLPTLVSEYGATEHSTGGDGRAYRINLDDGRYVLISEEDAHNLPPAEDMAVDIALCAADGSVIDDSHRCDVTSIEDVIFHYEDEA